jgi:hypothetical protein
LTDDYLAMIAAVEALPQNQSGSDKSHRGRPAALTGLSTWSALVAKAAVINPLGPVAEALNSRSVRHVLIGVYGANLYAPGGQSVFITDDADLFLPLDADNLVRAWDA